MMMTVGDDVKQLLRPRSGSLQAGWKPGGLGVRLVDTGDHIANAERANEIRHAQVGDKRTMMRPIKAQLTKQNGRQPDVNAGTNSRVAKRCSRW